MPRLISSRLFAVPTWPALVTALLLVAALLAGLALALHADAAGRADSDLHLAPMRWEPPGEPIG